MLYFHWTSSLVHQAMYMAGAVDIYHLNSIRVYCTAMGDICNCQCFKWNLLYNVDWPLFQGTEVNPSLTNGMAGTTWCDDKVIMPGQ
jgi:hypothetical protein